jgi:hypothetical protein
MTDLVFSSVPNNNQSPVDIVFSTGESPQQINWKLTYNNIIDSTNDIKRLLYNIETIKNNIKSAVESRGGNLAGVDFKNWSSVISTIDFNN